MYFIQVPSHVYLDKKLSRTSQNLYGLILSLSYKDGYCYATNKNLSDMLEVSARTINYALSDLTKAELIHIEINARNNFRKIMTIDTINGSKRLKTQKESEIKATVTRSKHKIERFVPEWMTEFEELLDNQ